MKGRWFLLIAFSVFAGCSTPQSRVGERPEVFASLPSAHREAVLQGGIVEGMNRDAVYFALGKPARVVRGQERGKPIEKWVYSRVEETPIGPIIPERVFDREVITTPRQTTIHTTVDIFEVDFENGKVIGWKNLDA
jgi:hypothetical protein